MRARRLLQAWTLGLAAPSCGAEAPRRPPIHFACRAGVGLARPLPVCSRGSPCREAWALADGGFSPRVLATPSDAPACHASVPTRPFVDDGPAVPWRDPAGVTRYACVYRAPGADGVAGAVPPRPPLPLVVWFHPAFSGAAALYDATSLRAKAPGFPLAGEGAPAGFDLVAVQARNLHWPAAGADGAHHDHFFRDLARNPDVAHADHVIDALAAAGGVDPRRIYVMGWSDGAAFGQLYALARHAAPTPGGHRVAAAAVYAAGDPYAAPPGLPGSPGMAGCAARRYPASALPLLVLGRSCDAVVPCDAAQHALFRAAPGLDAAMWSVRLQTAVGDRQAAFRLLDDRGGAVSSCSRECVAPEGERNHLRWPDGVDDVSGHDWEPAMLEFLRDHPLPAP